METVRRLPAGREHLVCGACPSLVEPFGAFDVVEKPSRESAYARQHGYRVDRATQTPVCVHPDRVGLPAGRYASDDEPLPADVEPAEPPPLPEGPDGLDAWLTGYLNSGPPGTFDKALGKAQDAALAVFPAAAVVDALRRVLESGQLDGC